MDLPDFLTRDDAGFVHVTGHRIGLQHLVHYYNDGYSPEMLASEYPTLSLALVHRLIAFYLENASDVDQYVSEQSAIVDAMRRSATGGPSVSELRARVQTASGR